MVNLHQRKSRIKKSLADDQAYAVSRQEGKGHHSSVLTQEHVCRAALDYGTFKQCCGAENISFGSGSMESQIRISAPPLFIRYGTLKITFFDFSNMIKILTIYKNFFRYHVFLSITF